MNNTNQEEHKGKLIKNYILLNKLGEGGFC